MRYCLFTFSESGIIGGMQLNPLPPPTHKPASLDKVRKRAPQRLPDLASRFLLEKEPPHLTPKVDPVMDIKQLTEKMYALVASKGWYNADSKRPQTPRNLAISLSLEAAEILEHFQFREEAKDKDELAGELADVALYLLQLASVSEIDLEQAILNKIEINKSREWDKE